MLHHFEAAVNKFTTNGLLQRGGRHQCLTPHFGATSRMCTQECLLSSAGISEGGGRGKNAVTCRLHAYTYTDRVCVAVTSLEHIAETKQTQPTPFIVRECLQQWAPLPCLVLGGGKVAHMHPFVRWLFAFQSAYLCPLLHILSPSPHMWPLAEQLPSSEGVGANTERKGELNE